MLYQGVEDDDHYEHDEMVGFVDAHIDGFDEDEEMVLMEYMAELEHGQDDDDFVVFAPP